MCRAFKYVIDAHLRNRRRQPQCVLSDTEAKGRFREGDAEACEGCRQLLRNKGWIDDPTRVNDLVQDVVMAMMGRTGSIPNWRPTPAIAEARRVCSLDVLPPRWPSATKEKTGRMGREDRPDLVQTATGSNRTAARPVQPDQGGAQSPQAIQKAIASILDLDTSNMGDDEEKFVDAIDSWATRAGGQGTEYSGQALRSTCSGTHKSHAVDRIQRHLNRSCLR